jgi:FkbH-like protein
MRGLLLSNCNMQPLISFLKPWDIVCGEFNSIIMDLVNPDSQAASPEFDQILCLFDGDAMLAEARYGNGTPDQCESFLAALESFCGAHPDKTVVSNTFCFGTGRWLSFADLLHPLSIRAIESRLNDRLLEIARAKRNLLLIDIELLLRRHGEDNLLSESVWYLGRIRYSNRMFRVLATTLHQAFEAYANRAKKVIILDLDNTLWGGILGEAGPLGITLSEDGIGRCYRDFQRALKSVQRLGVLLAICSKNNPEDLDDVFARNPMMMLCREDFVCIRANWEPKPTNILDIAQALNLGVDSFVFIDDNPVERDLVRKILPEVLVPEFPTKVETLLNWFLQEVVPAWFGKYTITAEDTDKTRQYKVNEERRHLSRGLDLDAYLESLKIECAFSVDPAEQVVRVAQMTQKTNQFNLTTRRYEVPDIQKFIDSQDHAVIVLEYKDRFGSEGAVGLAIVDYLEGRIDTFLMSCRVIGRKVEDQILKKACDLLQARGCSQIIAEFIPTTKNQQVSTFYDTHGFSLLAEEPNGKKLYKRSVG